MKNADALERARILKEMEAQNRENVARFNIPVAQIDTESAVFQSFQGRVSGILSRGVECIPALEALKILDKEISRNERQKGALVEENVRRKVVA